MSNTKKPQWLKAGGYSFLAYGAQLGCGFLAFMVIVRLFSAEAFGVWVMYSTLATLAEMSRNGLVQNGAIKFYQEEAEGKAEIVSASLALSLGAGVLLAFVGLGIGAFLAKWWQLPTFLELSWYLLPLVLLQAPTRFMDCIAMAEGNFKPVFWTKLAYGLVFLLALTFPWVLGWEVSLVLLPKLQLLAALSAFLTGIIATRRFIRFGSLRKENVWRLFQFGRYVMGTNLGSMLFNKMDIFILGSMLGPVAVGLYNAASRITNFVEVPLTSAAQVLYPRIAAGHAQQGREDVGRLYERGLALLLAIIFPLCLLVLWFAQPLVLLFAGEEYLPSAPVLQILTLAVLIKPWGRIFGITLDAIGKPRLNFRILSISLAVNLVLNLVLIPILGIQGVALATLLTLGGSAFAGQIVIRRFLPVNPINAFQQAFQVYQQLVHAFLTGKKENFGVVNESPPSAKNGQ